MNKPDGPDPALELLGPIAPCGLARHPWRIDVQGDKGFATALRGGKVYAYRA